MALVAVLHKEELGKRIRARRKELGLSQKGLAELVPVKEGQTVSRWERGANEPEDLGAVARALKFGSVSDMLKGIEQIPEKDRRRMDPDGETQLDRIEAKLDVLLTRLDEQTRLLQAEAEAREWEADEQGEAASNATARPRRRRQQ